MYLVRSPDFLLHLGAMHKHEQQWICERALKLVLSLFDRGKHSKDLVFLTRH
jgi:hypothetical protein